MADAVSGRGGIRGGGGGPGGRRRRGGGGGPVWIRSGVGPGGRTLYVYINLRGVGGGPDGRVGRRGSDRGRGLGRGRGEMDLIPGTNIACTKPNMLNLIAQYQEWRSKMRRSMLDAARVLDPEFYQAEMARVAIGEVPQAEVLDAPWVQNAQRAIPGPSKFDKSTQTE